MKRGFIFLVLLFQFAGIGFSQVKTSAVSGDTINRTDKFNNKNGYWEEKIGDQTGKGFYAG